MEVENVGTHFPKTVPAESWFEDCWARDCWNRWCWNRSWTRWILCGRRNLERVDKTDEGKRGDVLLRPVTLVRSAWGHAEAASGSGIPSIRRRQTSWRSFSQRSRSPAAHYSWPQPPHFLQAAGWRKVTSPLAEVWGIYSVSTMCEALP